MTIINPNNFYFKKAYGNKMNGKYHDRRVYPHFVHTFSRVHYLDREIFNVSQDALRQTRRAEQRNIHAMQSKDEKS